MSMRKLAVWGGAGAVLLSATVFQALQASAPPRRVPLHRARPSGCWRPRGAWWPIPGPR